MNEPNIMPAVVEHYDAVADKFSVFADSDFFNEYCERPAMFSLLGDVAGKQVLDAGCGAGRYSAWLIEQGAEIRCLHGGRVFTSYRGWAGDTTTGSRGSDSLSSASPTTIGAGAPETRVCPLDTSLPCGRALWNANPLQLTLR